MLINIWNNWLLPTITGGVAALMVYWIGRFAGTRIGERLPRDFPMSPAFRFLQVVAFVIFAWALGVLLLE